MKPLPHQITKAQECIDILIAKGIVYLVGTPRSGKTYTSILTVEAIPQNLRILVLTKKNAISGWHKFIDGNESLKNSYFVTNYEQIQKIKEEYDILILDEAHNFGTFPKPSKRILEARALMYDKPIILLSGTPVVESPAKIFHQCFISKYTPFEFRNFYAFHKAYGIPVTKFINGREMKFYDKTKPELMDKINEFCVYMTQEDAGISKEFQAVDKVHYIELNDDTKKRYNKLQRDRVINIDGKDLVCDSIMKLRTSLHMMESGVAKIEDDYLFIGNTEKIDYIKEHFGDTNDIGIMSHFIQERELLKKHFKHAQIFSSNAHSEGVDLSHLKHFIIISSDYSGSKFIQRRERIVNINGSNTLTVNHLIVKNAISEQVYNAVNLKMDFNNSCYQRVAL